MKKNPPMKNPQHKNPPNKNPPPAVKKAPKFREPDSAEVRRITSTTTKKPDPAIVRRRPGITTMTSQIGVDLILH